MTFDALYHFILKASFYIAAGVAACGILFAFVVFIRAKGPWRQRIRDNFGGGT